MFWCQAPSFSSEVSFYSLRMSGKNTLDESSCTHHTRCRVSQSRVFVSQTLMSGLSVQVEGRLITVPECVPLVLDHALQLACPAVFVVLAMNPVRTQPRMVRVP